MTKLNVTPMVGTIIRKTMEFAKVEKTDKEVYEFYRKLLEEPEFKHSLHNMLVKE